MAIVLDEKVISSPQVDPSVACGTGIRDGATQITGSFGPEEARELSLLINGGALPVPVETLEQRTVGPALGAQAITASAWAAAIGTALTALFIIVIYRLMGVLAAVALACYGLVSYAALAALGATLTLPGLAGFVLAVGMAVDANVLVFERTREEYAARRRPSPRSALAAGFRNAFSAIADSNITTLIAAALLFFLASGPVRGFGVTLGIGVLASMFSALVITRVLAEYATSRPRVRRRPRLTGIAAAVAALAHDVVVLVGVFAWIGKSLDGVFLAALLTVIGYSVNDSVVLFDRVRELARKTPRAPLRGIANQAILQTLPRTVNTGMGAAFILTALAVLGGSSLTDFALALLIGLAVGTYSSVFTAAPVAVELHRRGDRTSPRRRP